MDDEELARWGEFARGVKINSTPMSTEGWGTEIVHMWNVFGALEEKVRKLGE